MENNIKEIWKPVKDYENLYEVSNIGNIRSLDRIIKDKNGIVKIIKGKSHNFIQQNLDIYLHLYIKIQNKKFIEFIV